MALTEKDLKSIKGLIDGSIEQNNGKLIEQVKDIVEFAIEKSEIRADEGFNKIGERFDGMDKRFDGIDREINDLIETNQAFLEKFDDHEKRISKIEAGSKLQTA